MKTDRTELVTIFTEHSESKQCCGIFDNITLLLGHTQFSLKIRPVVYWYYVHTKQVAAVATECHNPIYSTLQSVTTQFTAIYRVSQPNLQHSTGCHKPIYSTLQGVTIQFTALYRVPQPNLQHSTECHNPIYGTLQSVTTQFTAIYRVSQPNLQ